MSAHTPGPWAVDLSDADEWGTWMIRGGKDGKYFVGEVYNGNGTPQNLFNARLIAAAPDIYEALQNLCQLIEDERGSLLAAPILKGAFAALAKAKGEA